MKIAALPSLSKDNSYREFYSNNGCFLEGIVRLAGIGLHWSNPQLSREFESPSSALRFHVSWRASHLRCFADGGLGPSG